MLTDQLKETTDFLKQRGFDNSFAGVVMGTGLGGFAGKIKVEYIVPYDQIPNFCTSTVESHQGQLISGFIGEKKIIAMQGRFHYYEGYTMQQVTFPIRVIQQLGAQYLLLSNASGGLNKKFKKGDLVLISDHINLQPDNPLRGAHKPEYGQRFVDMSTPYDVLLNKLLKKVAKAQKVKLRSGVYVAVSGPNLETKAEYRFLKKTGADMVGMSTVPEVIVANQVGLKSCAVSVITDECDPDNLKPVNIAEIIQVAGEADAVLSNLLAKVIQEL
ncbi:purine-nucleoside phosphorylase [soil metagenome]